MINEKNKIKILSLVLFLLFLATLFSLAFLFVTKKLEKPKKEEKSTSSVPVKIEWLTYTDPLYNYSFQYPSALYLKNKSQNSIMLDTYSNIKWIEGMREQQNKIYFPFLAINVHSSFQDINPDFSTLSDYLDKSDSKYQALSVSGIEAYLFSYTLPNKHQTIYLQKGDKIYQIDYAPLLGDEEVQQKVINSLKFN